MNIQDEYKKRRKEIKRRLRSFNKKDYFYELCFCLLTPQSNAYKCWDAVLELKKRDFKNKDVKVENILKNRTRFYKNKARYLKELKKCKIKFNRDFLVESIKGLGHKEASHFLRNVGYRDYAILDRHILKNLLKLKVIKEMPRKLDKKKYLDIERKFKEFSKKVKIPMDELDLLFWSLETGKVFK